MSLYALVDNGATGYGFINSSLARNVCHNLNILPFRLAKPRAIKAYNGRLGKPATHVLYVGLAIERHSEYDCPLLITERESCRLSCCHNSHDMHSNLIYIVG